MKTLVAERSPPQAFGVRIKDNPSIAGPFRTSAIPPPHLWLSQNHHPNSLHLHYAWNSPNKVNFCPSQPNLNGGGAT